MKPVKFKVPGLGEVKASKLLKDCEDAMMWGTIVMAQYVKYFGNHYGPVIYQETLDTLKLMSSKHRLWYQYAAMFDKNYSAMSFLGTKLYNTALRPFINSSDEYSPFNEVTEHSYDTSKVVERFTDATGIDPHADVPGVGGTKFTLTLGKSSEQQEKSSWGTDDPHFFEKKWADPHGD